MTQGELNYILSVWYPDCLNVFGYQWWDGHWTAECVVMSKGIPTGNYTQLPISALNYTDRRAALRDALRLAEDYLQRHAPHLIPFRSLN